VTATRFSLRFPPGGIHFVAVRIIKEAFLRDAAPRHPQAAASLGRWRKAVRNAAWRNITDVRATYPDADPVRVASGNTVYVFNICGKDFRLLCAIHFYRQRLFALRFLSHAEYSKDKWKSEL
jgi:mRNA interferase HigB